MILTVHVKPNARQNEIIEWLDEDTLKVSVTAPPEKGRANAAVIALIAKKLRIPKSTIELVRGHTTRMKHLRLPESSSEAIKNMSL